MLASFFKGEMGPDFTPKMAVKSLTSQQIVRVHQLFRQAKFDDPSGDVSFPWVFNDFMSIYVIRILNFVVVSYFLFL